MSGGKSFFPRWSRRKGDAVARSDVVEPPPSAPDTVKSGSPTTGEDPSALSLPPIETIESVSDIKAFLAPGVPLELTRTALRRAWRVDPAIRDFIGLSENAWDFNAPGGVPGFGSLDVEKVRRLAAQLLDEPRAADPASAAIPVADASATPAKAARARANNELRESIAKPQQKNGERGRHHGGALPQ
jgi:Protein of unknown function (DUF3306)